MEKERILEQFEDYPVIAAIKDENGLKKCPLVKVCMS